MLFMLRRAASLQRRDKFVSDPLIERSSEVGRRAKPLLKVAVYASHDAYHDEQTALTHAPVATTRIEFQLAFGTWYCLN
jgi:hypothetical protein